MKIKRFTQKVPREVRIQRPTHSPPLDEQAPPSLAVRQQPLLLKSMQNTKPPIRPRVGEIFTQAVFNTYSTLDVTPCSVWSPFTPHGAASYGDAYSKIVTPPSQGSTPVSLPNVFQCLIEVLPLRKPLLSLAFC
jgi:hypothetical protein